MYSALLVRYPDRRREYRPGKFSIGTHSPSVECMYSGVLSSSTGCINWVVRFEVLVYDLVSEYILVPVQFPQPQPKLGVTPVHSHLPYTLLKRRYILQRSRLIDLTLSVSDRIEFTVRTTQHNLFVHIYLNI